MTGYFSSGVLSELAFSISLFLNRNMTEPMRFIISPHLSDEDRLALFQAYEADDNIFNILFPEGKITAEQIREYTISALSYLISTGKIKLKIAVKKNGLFHAKAWMFDTDFGLISIHGSSNATSGGMFHNYEQLTLSRSWRSNDAAEICVALSQEFEQLWDDKKQGIKTLDLNSKTLDYIEKMAKSMPENSITFIKNLRADLYDRADEKEVYIPIDKKKLKIPKYIDYRSGAFKHQGDAVDAWMKKKKGILSIATGGGKTITSLIVSTKLTEELEHLLIVIAVPTKALMNQWENEVKEFGVQPINTNGFGSRQISQEIVRAIRRVRLKQTSSDVIIITHDALASGKYFVDRQALDSIDSFLIVDEAHNLGSERSQANFPIDFKYKMGLSATYERQFDEKGTEFLVETFGPVVYEYSLSEAIGNCLVKYNYFAHFVSLSEKEEEEFIELTQAIKKISVRLNNSDDPQLRERWQSLCLRRRRVIESAENKLYKFRKVFPKRRDDVNRTLIFCTDKDPEQILLVNNYLNELNLNFHQVTGDETSNNALLKNIISAFADDELQVLTSKRVLDEGFNVPQTESAYLLASSTVTRQWIQRLGRVLRLSPATSKTEANVYDFIALPDISGPLDEDLKALLLTELNRITFFSKYSKNFLHRGGGNQAIEKIIHIMRTSN